MAANFSALAASNGLLLVTHNPADGGPGYADVWCAMVRAMDANAPPELVPVRRLQEHTGPLYACALDGRMLATGGDDGTVRLWCGASLLLPDDCAGQPQPMASLQTLHLPGKVWALALHSHILVAGGALDYDRFDYGRSQGRHAGQICVTLFGVADLAIRRGPAVTLRTLQAPSIALDWGVRSVATYGGTVVVAGGDDGVVHVWTLAEKGKLDRPDVHF
jgi:WD40 repeat protein